MRPWALADPVRGAGVSSVTLATHAPGHLIAGLVDLSARKKMTATQDDEREEQAFGEALRHGVPTIPRLKK